jgi:hypothetical protein
MEDEVNELSNAASITKFLLNAPPYKVFTLDAGLDAISLLSGGEDRSGRRLSTMDGYCPYCRRDTTFNFFERIIIPAGNPWDHVQDRVSFDRTRLRCVRDQTHLLAFWTSQNRMTIQKVGQMPSLADIAIDEVRSKYRSVLQGDNWSELYKAIGLAAHGEGVGSFVYLRRVIERLVRSRFDEVKVAEGWKDDDFKGLRMSEKMELLSGHLPSYLVTNRRLYSIFSVGVHELDNDDCLAFYEIGMRTIVMILQDDLQQREQADARMELDKAIANFTPRRSAAEDEKGT